MNLARMGVFVSDDEYHWADLAARLLNLTALRRQRPQLPSVVKKGVEEEALTANPWLSKCVFGLELSWRRGRPSQWLCPLGDANTSAAACAPDV